MKKEKYIGYYKQKKANCLEYALCNYAQICSKDFYNTPNVGNEWEDKLVGYKDKHNNYYKFGTYQIPQGKKSYSMSDLAEIIFALTYNNKLNTVGKILKNIIDIEWGVSGGLPSMTQDTYIMSQSFILCKLYFLIPVNPA